MNSIRTISTIVVILTATSVSWAQPAAKITRPQPLGGDIPKLILPEETVDDVRWWLQYGRTKKIQPKELDLEKLKELMDKLPKDQKPDQKQIEEFIKDNPQFKDKEFLQQLEKLVKDEEFPKQLNQKLPDNAKLPPNLDKGELQDKLDQVIKTGNQPDPFTLPKDMNLPKMDANNPDLPKDINDPSLPKSNAADNEWVKWMEKNFGNTPAGESAVKDLISALEKNEKGAFSDIPEFKNGGWKDFDKFDKFGKSNGNDPWKMKPPETPGNKFTTPKVNSGGGSSWGGGGGGSSLGGGGGGGGLDGGGTALAIIAGIVAAVLLAILLFRKWKLNQEEKAAMASAGKGGIDFDAIRSREELVRVFNAVSLDQCGDDALPWNHRVVADQFGRAKPAVAEPAEQVAGLYERARYAPADEDLSTNEFADARRDLRLLAGAPA